MQRTKLKSKRSTALNPSLARHAKKVSPAPGKKKRSRVDRAAKRKRKVSNQLAHDPNLIEAIQRDIAATGLVGEREAGALVYIVATSRLSNGPAALVIRGPSGAGKSEAQRRPLELIPDEAKIDVTTLTPNALYWMEEGALSHKLLTTGERKHRQDDDAADSNSALRQLLSEGRISKASPVKTKDGIQTKRIEQAGPVAYIETTTAKSIFAEDLNRMLQVYVDDSEEQTKAVMRELAEAKAGRRQREDISTIVERHWEFQRALEGHPVLIPFADQITLPASKVVARRAFRQVLTVIEAVTLMYQFQREKDDKGRLIATVDDYAVARRLLLGPIHAVVGIGAKYEKVKRLKRRLTKKVFTQNDVKAAGEYKSKMGPSRVIKELLNDGFLVVLEKAWGKRPAKYKWVQGIESILPAEETIREAVSKCVT